MIFKGDGGLSWYRTVSRKLATAALWVRIHTSPKKIQNGRHKQRNGQHTLARLKNIQKDLFYPVSHQTTQMNNDPDLKPCRFSKVRVWYNLVWLHLFCFYRVGELSGDQEIKSQRNPELSCSSSLKTSRTIIFRTFWKIKAVFPTSDPTLCNLEPLS